MIKKDERLLSVIIPIYNTDAYLEETITSVINQDIGFRDNIQIILVNDGSIDNSEEICLRYEGLYPENISYVKQENQGVSIARNKGLSFVSGRYVHFLDSDDLVSKNFYRKSVEFLGDNKEIDIVASKIKFFDAIIDSHPLNYKFKKTRVINLNEQPDNPLLHMATCVFRRESLRGLAFDKRLKISEDARFLSEVLYNKKRYGVLENTAYFYRKRKDESSAIDGKLMNREFYLLTPKLVYEHMIKHWTSGGRVHEYIQHTILYDLGYRISQSTQSVLTPDEVGEYKKNLKSIVEVFDDKVIMSRKDYDIHTKLFVLRMKYRERSNKPLFVLREKPSPGAYIFLDFINKMPDGKIEIEGYSEEIGGNGSLDLIVNGKITPILATDRAQRKRVFLGDQIYDGGGFIATVPLSGGSGDFLEFRVDGNPLNIKFGKFTNLNNISGSYARLGSHLIYRRRKKLVFKNYSRLKSTTSEILYLFRIFANWQVQSAIEQFEKLRNRNLSQLSLMSRLFEILKPLLFVAEAAATVPQAIYLRIAYRVGKQLKKKKLWLISDRGMSAGDNGEALFRHIQKKKDINVKTYFVISRKSSDYRRMRAVGPVLAQGGLRHKLLFLLADNIISSHADIEVTNPFFRQIGRFVDLFNFNFIFLQHGVIRHDHSSWLNRYDKNIKLFVASADIEYRSILSYPYYYQSRDVLLSGLPRFDYLKSRPSGKLIIAPTYRANILRTKTDKNGVRPYDPLFKESGYYIFYNDLINDKRLTAALEASSMTAELYIHPNFASQRSDFSPGRLVSIPNYPYDYNKALSQGSLLVSDYSSIVLDFAYMKKPVIYAKFDEDEFYNTHSYGKSEFFDDGKNGFGPVTYTYDDLVMEIVKLIENSCKMEAKYQKHVDKFFAWRDKDNSERVYRAIINQPRSSV